MRPGSWFGAGLVVLTMAVTGCTSPTPEPTIPVVEVITATPSPPGLTVAVSDDGGSDIQVSAAVFDTSPVVIVSPADDAQLMAASAAVALGVPLLSAPTTKGRTASVRTELDRLRTTTVVTIGTLSNAEELGTEGRSVIALPGDAASVIAALRLDLESATPETGLSDLSAVAALEPFGGPILSDTGDIDSASDSDPTTSSPVGSDQVVPDVLPGRALAGTVALVPDTASELAATATARAAGADIIVVPEHTTDLFAVEGALAALAASGSSSVLSIGAGFASDPALQWKVDVALSGARLPSGGVRWFPGNTLIAIYGVPGTGALGILGEQDAAQSVARARSIAAPYADLTGTTVVPTFEIIATVAAREAGADGNYSNEVPIERISPWVQAAADAGMQVILDLQPGRSDFLSQAKLYEPLLKLPNVGLALDPEWRLAPNQVPLAQIGSVDAAEVNGVIHWLADLTRDNALPQKVLVLHQFQLRMIGNRSALDTTRAEVAVVIHADGQGSQPAKQSTWNALRADAPAGIAWGWKNFYDEDNPTLTPEQTMTHVVPQPNMVSYQ